MTRPARYDLAAWEAGRSPRCQSPCPPCRHPGGGGGIPRPERLREPITSGRAPTPPASCASRRLRAVQRVTSAPLGAIQPNSPVKSVGCAQDPTRWSRSEGALGGETLHHARVGVSLGPPLRREGPPTHGRAGRSGWRSWQRPPDPLGSARAGRAGVTVLRLSVLKTLDVTLGCG